LNLAVKITLLASGIFLFVGMIAGVLKYAGMMNSTQHRAPIYIDIAHRAALLYSFAALVMAALLYFSPYSLTFQLFITGAPLVFFALSIAQYLKLGIENRETTQFSERNFSTTWGMLLLVVGEIGGMGFIVWGFISTQLLA
jgi:hypothetical protein